MNTHRRFICAADAFAPLEAGSYVGAIEPGAYVECFVLNGNTHASLGLRLGIGKSAQRVVQVRFLLKSDIAPGVMRQDNETLAKWRRLVGAPPARGWRDLVRELWTRQQFLGVDVSFTLRFNPRGRAYSLTHTRLWI